MRTERRDTEPERLSSAEIVSLSRRYTLYDWTAQEKADPIPVERAEGVYFYTPDGKRYLDFNSQLMGVNIGHGDPRVVEAIAEQARTLPYVSPFLAHEPRARLGRKLVELLPGDISKVFFTLGGAEANENAIRMARLYNGRQKVLAQYRSYHGATAGAITLTGDPRRWPNEPGIPGVVHVLNPHHRPGRPVDTADQALEVLEETIELEGPGTIAAFILEPVVREICDRYGILLIADEVMTGFGRTGEWFAVDHWGVVPDLMTLAKGLTSSYVPLGAVGMREPIARFFDDTVFAGGLTYNSHPISCAAALATIEVYEEDGLVGNAKRMGEVMRSHHQALMARHPSIGAARNIGLFGIIELVRDRATMEPLSPFNRTSEEMQGVMRSPPLCITEQELAEGFGIIDGALEVSDRATTR